MLRKNFFYNFFNYKTNNKILKYNSKGTFDLENEIIEINQQISKNSQALIEAQIVKFKSNFSKSNNFIEKIGKNVYKQKLEDSINWHQKQLKELYFRRRELEINIEKIKGIYWLNQIKRFLQVILIGLLILFSLFIFLSGFMILIYLLPIILLIFLGYLLAAKKY